MTFSCSKSICTRFLPCGLGLALCKQPTLHSHISLLLQLHSTSLKIYNRERYLYTHYTCSPARVQHAYNDIRLHNTINTIMVNTPQYHAYWKYIPEAPKLRTPHYEGQNCQCHFKKIFLYLFFYDNKFVQQHRSTRNSYITS